MDQKGENKLIVTSEYEWSVKKVDIDKGYVISEIFEISLLNNKTKWQIVLYNDSAKIHACLHKVESSNNDFIVDLTMNAAEVRQGVDKKIANKRYDGNIFNDNWFYFQCVNEIFYCIQNCDYCDTYKQDATLQIKVSLELKTEASSYQSNYEKLFNSNELIDFKFICSDGKEINAHRLILVAHSPVMHKMLTTPMIESKNSEVKLEDIDSETMLEAMRFIYTGKLNIFENFAPKLLYCAEKYELCELKKFVAQLMIKNLSVENVLEYFALAEQYDEDDLLNCCILEIKRNYRTICQHEDWAKFDRKMKALFEIFMKDIQSVQVIKTSKAIHSSMDLPKEYNKFG